MLVLSRKFEERIVIGGQLVITITELSGGIATLVVESPTALPATLATIVWPEDLPEGTRPEITNRRVQENGRTFNVWEFQLYRNDVVDFGNDIYIVLCGVRADKARIGVQAPRNVSVHRAEVQDEVDRKTA